MADITVDEFAVALRETGWPDYGSVPGSSRRHAELILAAVQRRRSKADATVADGDLATENEPSAEPGA